ncbi:MAG: carboxymuconolactone decarboxylase family protein [Thermomicrobiales bacterium]
MEQRIDLMATAPGAMNSVLGIVKYLSTTNIDKTLNEVVSMRVSQINGCAYCLNMHATALRAKGYPQRNLDLLTAWREVDVYSVRERTALTWAEAVTLLPNKEVPDDVYEEVRKIFDEKDLGDLTLAITTINTFNRFNIAFRNPPDFGANGTH